MAELLYRAKDKCGRCKSKAPFTRRTDHSPYLEVHHKTPLAAQGEDTVENAVELCPNCHRELHDGVNANYPAVPANGVVAAELLRQAS